MNTSEFLRRSARAALSCVVVAAVSGHAAEPPTGSAPEIRYEDAGRTFYESFSGNFWRGAKIRPREPIGDQKSPFYGERVSSRLHDCSDAHYRCVFGMYRVFAVPRAWLTPTSTYKVAGSVLKVEECLRGEGRRCQVALIRSECQQNYEKDECRQADAGVDRGQTPTPILYFIYNEDFGVTAYGSVTQAAKSPDERHAIVTQMLLRSEQGQLKD